MKLLLDQNMPRFWEAVLQDAGYDAILWSHVGSRTADDIEICAWASANGRIVLTQDLDFGAILAASGATSPSVVILRARDSRPPELRRELLFVLEHYAFSLGERALIVLDHHRHRVRMLPLDR